MKDLPSMSGWLAAILFPAHAIFMRRYFKVEVVGGDNIPASGPFILAPIHRSRWDAILLYCVVKDRTLYFMASHEEMTGLQGWFMRRMGAFPINAKRPSSSTIRSCSEMISRGDALVIFPEGDLFYYGPGEVHPLKPGVAWLALNFLKGSGDADLPIVPIRFVYGERGLRWGSRVQILVRPPISISEFAELPGKEGMFALTSALQEALGGRGQSNQCGRIAPRGPVRLIARNRVKAVGHQNEADRPFRRGIAIPRRRLRADRAAHAIRATVIVTSAFGSGVGMGAEDRPAGVSRNS